MKRKNRLYLMAVAIVAGMVMVGSGSMKLIVAQAETVQNPDTELNPVGISLGNPNQQVEPWHLDNLAPGDHGQETLLIRNTGTASEVVQVNNYVDGALFGQSTTDNHPLNVTFTIHVYGANDSVQPVVYGPLKLNDKNSSLPFHLAKGQKALVTYTYELPKAAGNGYQGSKGSLNIEVVASSDTDRQPTPPPSGHPKPPVVGGTTPVTGFPMETLLVEGIALLVVGGGLTFMARRMRP